MVCIAWTVTRLHIKEGHSCRQLPHIGHAQPKMEQVLGEERTDRQCKQSRENGAPHSDNPGGNSNNCVEGTPSANSIPRYWPGVHSPDRRSRATCSAART